MDEILEKDILLEVYTAIINTFNHPSDDKIKDIPEVANLMRDHFIHKIILDISKDSPPKGISFTTIGNAFSYFFTKTIDSALILHEEGGLYFGLNVLYDYNDIKNETCGVSEYFNKYDINANDEYAIGEMYLLSFQGVCIKHAQEIQNPSPLLIKMIGGALLSIIPHAIHRAQQIISSK